MLVRTLQKPTIQNNQNNQTNQNDQNNQNSQNSQNHTFRINVEFAGSGIVVTNLLIDTTDKHGYQAVRRQIADCWSSKPGFETSLVAQNKMLVLVNHGGWHLHQRNFCNVKPGDTLVVTADLVAQLVDELHQQHSKTPIWVNEQMLQAMQAVASQTSQNVCGLKVFKQQSKLLACIGLKYHSANRIPEAASRVYGFARTALEWLYQQDLDVKQHLCSTCQEGIMHICYKIYVFDSRLMVELVKMAVQVENAAFAEKVCKFRPPVDEHAVNAAADYLVAHLVNQTDEKSPHLVSLLLSHMYARLTPSNQSYKQHIKPCLAALHSCNAGTAVLLWDAIYCLFKRMTIHRFDGIISQCAALLDACVASTRRWLIMDIDNLGHYTWNVVYVIMDCRLCSWRDLVASSFLDSNIMVLLYENLKRQPRTCGRHILFCNQLARMIDKCCDDWSFKLCDQLTKLIAVVAKACLLDQAMALLRIFCKFDRQIMLQHMDVLLGVLDQTLGFLVDNQRNNYSHLKVVQLCCETLHKLGVQHGEPGRQSLVANLAKFHQKCKALKHKKYCHIKIWAGKLAKQYTNQPDLPDLPDQPNQPGQPIQPNQPGQPGQPIQPGQPGQPGQPIQPIQPIQMIAAKRKIELVTA